MFFCICDQSVAYIRDRFIAAVVKNAECFFFRQSVDIFALTLRWDCDTVGNQVKTYEAYGDELMRAGIPVDRQDLNKKGGDFASLLYTIKKVD